MRVKYAKDIIKEIQARGSIQVPEGYITGEAFEEWLEGKERFGMSISEQIKELRETAELFEKIDDGRSMLLQAADIIEALSAKLAAANIERSDRHYGGWWITVDENNLPQGEVLGCNAKSGMAVGKIKKVREGDIRVVDFLGGGLMDCIAYMPLPEPYHP